MRRGAAWLVTLPIALVGVEAGHALANAAFGAPAEAGELFASGESGAGLVPVLAALALGLLLLGLGGRVAGSWWLPRRARSVALPFACLPPVVFVLLELVEGTLHSGPLSWSWLYEPTFFAGLVLQLPFALAGYLLALGLLRLSDGIRSLVVRRRCARPLASPPALSSAPCDERPRVLRRSWAHSGRAPPAALVASR